MTIKRLINALLTQAEELPDGLNTTVLVGLVDDNNQTATAYDVCLRGGLIWDGDQERFIHEKQREVCTILLNTHWYDVGKIGQREAIEK